MGIPLFCATCHDFVGMEHTVRGMQMALDKGGTGEMNIPCPGKGKHEEPITITKNVHCGLSIKVLTIYPETDTMSISFDYQGPNHPFFLWLAVLFSSIQSKEHVERVYVDDKWVSWSFGEGFYGEGYDAFQQRRGRRYDSRET